MTKYDLYQDCLDAVAELEEACKKVAELSVKYEDVFTDLPITFGFLKEIGDNYWKCDEENFRLTAQDIRELTASVNRILQRGK